MIIIFAITAITYIHELAFGIRARSGGPRLRPRDFQLAVENDKSCGTVERDGETAGARRATAARGDENGDARPTSTVALAATHDTRRDAK